MTDTPAHWRNEIERLDKMTADAEQGLVDAKQNAAQVILDGGEDASKEIALWRDRLEACHTAKGEAQRRLKAAEDSLSDKARQAAQRKAQDAARDRHTAALDFDSALAAAEVAYSRFLAANLKWRQHMLDAGQKPFGTEKLSAGEAIRGAITAAAYSLSGTLNARPHGRDSRIPLASFVAQQTPPSPKKYATKQKAAA